MVLKALSELNGVSGNENSVREFIIEQIREKTDSYKVDKIGNLLAEKKGTDVKGPKVLLCAHMDEVGLFVTEITADGYLKFQPVGGIDGRILVSKPVNLGKNNIPGVIGAKAIHLQKPEERQKSWNMEELYIDIGAATKEEADKVVAIGDYAAFTSLFEPLGSELWKGKALDDRAGCAVIMKILEDRYNCDLTAAFTVQEEIGLRGSKVVSNYIEADLAIIVETTQASDLREEDEEEWVVEVGRGPACSLMDSATIYRPGLIRKAAELAGKNNIPLQYRRGTTAANDAGNIHKAGQGIPTLTISIPCRNIHSMSSMISRKDYEHTLALIQAILKDIREFCS